MKTVFFTIISDSHYHGCRTDDFIKSFKRYHPDIDLVIFGQKEIDETFSLDHRVNFYNAKGTFAKKLYNDYELVVNIDADHIILDRMTEILEADYDVACPSNFNTWLNSGIRTQTHATGYGAISDKWLVHMDRYLQGGLIASTSKLFWDQYAHASIQTWEQFGHKENDVLNIMMTMLPYKLKVLDGDYVFSSPGFSCYYNCASLARERQMYIEDGKVWLDGKQVKCYHFARGGSVKPSYESLFSPEVVNFIKEKVLE